MKKILFFIIAITLFSCSFHVEHEMAPLTYDKTTSIQGDEKTVIFKSTAYGRSAEEAIERAKMLAVYTVIFQGINNTNSMYPMINDDKLLQNKEEYFKAFFGVKNIELMTNGSNRYGKASADYRNFVAIAGDGSIKANDRIKVGKELKVTIVVSVNIHQLRRKLENDEIINKLSHGF